MDRFQVSATLIGLMFLLAVIAFGIVQCNTYRWQQYKLCIESGTPYAVCTNPRLQSW